MFVGGLTQTMVAAELIKYFEKVAGPVADVLLPKVRACSRPAGWPTAGLLADLAGIEAPASRPCYHIACATGRIT